MKSIYLPLTFLLTVILSLTGCYTSFNSASTDYDHQAVHIDGGWFEIEGANFYIDYSTRYWYNYYGIDLATDTNFLKMAYFRFNHPTSTYYHSPFRNHYFYSYPGYSNNSFYRMGLISPWHSTFASHYPPFYSNPYMHNFYYNRWAQWRYWYSNFPNGQEGSFAHGSSGSTTGFAPRSNGLSTTGGTVNTRTRSVQTAGRLAADGEDHTTVTQRDRVLPARADLVPVSDRQRNLRDRRDSDYRNRLEENRAVRSPLSSWSSWEQSNNYNQSVGRTRSAAHTSSAVSRTGTARTGGATVRGSSGRSGSSGSATTRSAGSSRSAGESSSSRGSN